MSSDYITVDQRGQQADDLYGQAGTNSHVSVEQPAPTVRDVTIQDIRRDSPLQVRKKIDDRRVKRYAELMEDGVDFDPIVLFDDGEILWQGDGTYRILAATRNAYETIRADVRQGTERDAFLYGLHVNAAHGLPLTHTEKRAAAVLMLQDDEIQIRQFHKVLEDYMGFFNGRGQ